MSLAVLDPIHSRPLVVSQHQSFALRSAGATTVVETAAILCSDLERCKPFERDAGGRLGDRKIAESICRGCGGGQLLHVLGYLPETTIT